MRESDDRNLVLLYIYLAAGVVMLGIGITFALLGFLCLLRHRYHPALVVTGNTAGGFAFNQCLA